MFGGTEMEVRTRRTIAFGTGLEIFQNERSGCKLTCGKIDDIVPHDEAERDRKQV